MSKLRKLSLVAATLALSISLVTGADAAANIMPSLSSTTAPAAKSSAYADAVYNKAVKLLKKQDGLAYAKSYIIKHIKSVTRSQATLLVLKLENAANSGLVNSTEKLLAEQYQTELSNLYKQGDSIAQILKRTKDQQLRKLLTDLRDSGYKLYAIEGMIYPIVDYDTLTGFKPYVNTDIRSYIDIMSAESGQPSVGDGALLISWSEVIERALAQEAFILSYPKSNRARLMSNMYTASLTYLFYGMPNTPLFVNDTKRLDPAARKAFDKLLVNGDLPKSDFRQKLKAWSDVLKQNGDKLTSQVEKHRKSSAPGKSW